MKQIDNLTLVLMAFFVFSGPGELGAKETAVGKADSTPKEESPKSALPKTPQPKKSASPARAIAEKPKTQTKEATTGKAKSPVDSRKETAPQASPKPVPAKAEDKAPPAKPPVAKPAPKKESRQSPAEKPKPANTYAPKPGSSSESSKPAAQANPAIEEPEAKRETSETPLVAEVNGQPVSAYDFEKLLIEQLQAGINDSVELRKKVRDELVVQTLLSQLAMENGLDASKEVELAFESARRTILSNAWRQNWARENPVEEKEIASEYNATIQRLGGTEFQLRQVVVPDETAALLILDQLEEGKDLGDLARKYTTEAGGKKSKGLLPWVSPSLLLPPLGDLVSKAKAGDLLESPVRTQAGWHVVRVEGVRALKPPSVEQLSQQLSRGIKQQRLTREIQKLLDQAKIKF